jgi:hypothetical protein
LFETSVTPSPALTERVSVFPQSLSGEISEPSVELASPIAEILRKDIWSTCNGEADNTDVEAAGTDGEAAGIERDLLGDGL